MDEKYYESVEPTMVKQGAQPEQTDQRSSKRLRHLRGAHRIQMIAGTRRRDAAHPRSQRRAEQHTHLHKVN
uniref:Uncharacterized protein n=1 Tax=Ascaris lumbricoides TaxID=6252 RepID=A0A0M3HU46_ASCLU